MSEYDNYVVSVKGHIAIRPRILDPNTKEQVVKVHTIFDIKMLKSLPIDDPWGNDYSNFPGWRLHQLRGQVQSIFESQDAKYTDEYGVIQSFTPPACPWWIVIESIQITKYIPKVTASSSTNPITIEGEVVSSEEVAA